MFSKILKLAVVSGVAFVVGESAEGETAVLTVTKDNFDQFVKDNELALVKFYAPWCGHCKSMAPEFEAAAAALKDKVALADVDATVETELAERFKIQGFPTLKFLRSGNWEEYSGGRTQKDIEQWIEVMTGESYSVATSYEEGVKAVEEATVGIIVQAKKDSEFFKTIEKAANANRLLGKWVVVEAEENSITAIRKVDDTTVVNKDAATEEEIVGFLKTMKVPYFGPINGETFSDYTATGLDFIWFAADKSTYDEVKTDMVTVGKALAGKANLVWLNVDEFKAHAENMLNVTEFPALVYTNEAGRYIFAGKEYSVETVTKFHEDAVDGKLERSLKSEEEPETNDEPVKIVVGKNFEESVFHKDQDVFVEVYAPWCGHCKKLDPEYTKFAEELKANDHLLVTKLDGTANEIPHADFQFRGFPTIFFVKAGESKPVLFDGARTFDGLMKFYDENGTKTPEQKVEL